MPSDYLSKYVLIAFYAQEQEAGTRDDRAQFSDDLFTRFDHHIVAAATEANLEVSVESRSIMAAMASQAPGSSPKVRAAHAVRAYREYRGL